MYRSLEAALSSGRLKPADSTVEESPLIGDGDLPGGAAAMVARNARGDCRFYHRSSGLCVIHRDLGETYLPSTCRHFPRLAMRDARGTFITLSHYCPTAASALFRDDVPLEIVANPPAFPPADYEGLVVDEGAWPPLLTPRMLMDLEGYAEWERHMVHRCADQTLSPEAVLTTLARDACCLHSYRPGGGSLAEMVKSLPSDVIGGPPPASLTPSLDLHDEVMQAVPDDLKPPQDSERLLETFEREVLPAWNQWHMPVKRYLAAKAFASWTAYQGRGLLSIVQGLEAALALVRVAAAKHCRDAGRRLDGALLREAFRSADFALNHLAVGEDLASLWSRADLTYC